MNTETMSVSEVWELLEEKTKIKSEAVKEMGAYTYGFKLSGDEAGEYTLDFKGDDVVIEPSLVNETDCTLELSDKNFKKLVNGNLNATSAFMMGKIKVVGNIGLALKLEKLLKTLF